MNIFALDSSGSAASAAVLRDGRVIAESFCDVGLTHSVTLLEICDQVFKRASLSPADIDLYALSEGPGSFTGLRIGASLLKGFAMPSDIPCAGVSTLEAISHGISSPGAVIVPVCDARRDRVYCAAFRDEERLLDDRTEEISALPSVLASLVTSFVFTGDAAEKTVSLLGDALDCTAAPQHLRMCRASAVGAVAFRMYAEGSIIKAAELAPKYHQLSQAERERNRKQETRGGEQE